MTIYILLFMAGWVSHNQLLSIIVILSMKINITNVHMGNGIALRSCEWDKKGCWSEFVSPLRALNEHEHTLSEDFFDVCGRYLRILSQSR